MKRFKKHHSTEFKGFGNLEIYRHSGVCSSLRNLKNFALATQSRTEWEILKSFAMSLYPRKGIKTFRIIEGKRLRLSGDYVETNDPTLRRNH